jgi:hypothetical protein
LPGHPARAVPAHSGARGDGAFCTDPESGDFTPANYEEADDGTGKRDEIAKKKIALRELKETRLRLRMLRRCNLLNADHDPLIKESDELVRIVATVIRNAEGNPRAKSVER